MTREENERYARMSWSQLKDECKNMAIQEYDTRTTDAVREKIKVNLKSCVA